MQKLLILFVFIIKAHELMVPSLIVHINGAKPADFSLQGVVPGFAEGLTKVGEGGQIILFIPSDLAYGDNPRRGGVIQPGDTLIFECELIKINP